MSLPPAEKTSLPSASSDEMAVAAKVALRPLWQRICYIIVAVINLGLGILGAITPGLPTTVFILIAAWAAARGYPPLYFWLLRHKIFGPIIINWQNGGTVGRRAKWHATAVMLLCAVILLVFVSILWVKVLAIGCMLVVNIWLWYRPEPKQ